MWDPSVSTPIVRHGFVYRVELYFFPLEMLGAVEIPSYQETRTTRGATVLWHSPEPKCFSQCRPFATRGEGAHI